MKKRVLVGMSGGVDSSVAAYILQKKGYEVIGATMDLWQNKNINSCQNSCGSNKIFQDAKLVCDKLGIPHYIINFREKFRSSVIANFKDEYLRGRTPNPCVVCNTVIKWGELLRKADELNCQFLATGHYAKVIYDSTTKLYRLLKGRDITKDQSYFLYGINQKTLSRALFPLEELSKKEVRNIAAQLDLKNRFNQESMEICFIPDNNYKRFIKEELDEETMKFIRKGDICYLSGKKTGNTHDGYPFYTIGQRKGLGGGYNKPMYVAKIDPIKNIVYIAEKLDLLSNSVIVKNFNWIYPVDTFPFKAQAKIRFNTRATECFVNIDNSRMVVKFEEPVFAVTPGQSCVIYQEDEVLGGGIICDQGIGV